MSAGQRGFTLIEALVAFAIVALSLGVLIRGVGLMSRGEASADIIVFSRNQAENHLARLGVTVPFEIGTRTGYFERGLIWRETVSYWTENESSFTGLRAFRIILEVSRSGSNQVVIRLETSKITTIVITP